MKLFGAWWGREVRVSSSPLSCWHGILPLHGAISNHLQGLQANAGELLVFSPGQEVDVTWHEGTKAIVIALDAALLLNHRTSPSGSPCPEPDAGVVVPG